MGALGCRGEGEVFVYICQENEDTLLRWLLQQTVRGKLDAKQNIEKRASRPGACACKEEAQARENYTGANAEGQCEELVADDQASTTTRRSCPSSVAHAMWKHVYRGTLGKDFQQSLPSISPSTLAKHFPALVGFINAYSIFALCPRRPSLRLPVSPHCQCSRGKKSTTLSLFNFIASFDVHLLVRHL